MASADVPRFAALDAVANLQPLWACHEPQLDELTLPFLEPGARGTALPVRRARTGPAPGFAAGSDWPVSSADPLAGIRVAVTRVEAGLGCPAARRRRSRRSPWPTAFAAYTAGGAWVNGRETDTGRDRTRDSAPTSSCSTATRSTARPRRSTRPSVVSTWIDGVRVFPRD